MTSVCEEIHASLERLPRIRYPFAGVAMPENGIYFFYEEGEAWGHGGDAPRIVRVGTHRDGNFRQRIESHFLTRPSGPQLASDRPKPSDRSIFRKNIGRALLSKERDPYLEVLEIDFTTRRNRESLGHRRNVGKEREVEDEITRILRTRFSFRFVEIEEEERRMGPDGLERPLIGALASCPCCASSPQWLGRHSSVDKIAQSGLWLVQHLSSPPPGVAERRAFSEAVDRTLLKFGKTREAGK